MNDFVTTQVVKVTAIPEIIAIASIVMLVVIAVYFFRGHENKTTALLGLIPVSLLVASFIAMFVTDNIANNTHYENMDVVSQSYNIHDLKSGSCSGGMKDHVETIMDASWIDDSNEKINGTMKMHRSGDDCHMALYTKDANGDLSPLENKS